MGRFSDCNAGLLLMRETREFSSSEDYQQALLAILDEASFSSVQNSGAAGASYAGVSLSGSYEEFRESYTRRFQLTQGSWSRKTATRIIENTLVGDAGESYRFCIQKAALGLDYDLQQVGPDFVRGNVSHLTAGGASQIVTDSFIKGGKTRLPSGVADGKLFPDNFEIKAVSDQPFIIDRDPGHPLVFGATIGPYGFTEYVPAPLHRMIGNLVLDVDLKSPSSWEFGCSVDVVTPRGGLTFGTYPMQAPTNGRLPASFHRTPNFYLVEGETAQMTAHFNSGAIEHSRDYAFGGSYDTFGVSKYFGFGVPFFGPGYEGIYGAINLTVNVVNITYL